MKYNSFYQVKDNSWNCGDTCPVNQVWPSQTHRGKSSNLNSDVRTLNFTLVMLIQIQVQAGIQFSLLVKSGYSGWKCGVWKLENGK